ncbi:hypothetical protein PR048_031667 [Dryococelus australis]|uniref:GST N-terminal domain-containing protein n=1 Tax=Dryococelus australis TaxID=614101 RepID=A0ABQ9G5X3_9NEOP|nr:hypothetical protein PR048_031667 [Dryococelus australis]
MEALGAILPAATGGSTRGRPDERTAARGPPSMPDESPPSRELPRVREDKEVHRSWLTYCRAQLSWLELKPPPPEFSNVPSPKFGGKTKIPCSQVPSEERKTMAIDLYYFPPSPPSWVVILVAKAFDIHLNIKTIDLFKGEQFDPEFTKINPAQKIPVIVDDRFSLSERILTIKYSRAPRDASRGHGEVVVRLLASHQGEPGSIPGGVATRTFACGNRANDAAGRGFSRGISRFLRPCNSGAVPYSPHFTLIGSQGPDVKSRPDLFTRFIHSRYSQSPPPPFSDPVVHSQLPPAGSIKNVEKSVGYLDRLLEGEEWVAGEHVSIAYYSLVVSVTVSEYETDNTVLYWDMRLGVDLSKYPNVERWFSKATDTIVGHKECKINLTTAAETFLEAVFKKHQMIEEEQVKKTVLCIETHVWSRDFSRPIAAPIFLQLQRKNKTAHVPAWPQSVHVISHINMHRRYSTLFNWAHIVALIREGLTQTAVANRLGANQSDASRVWRRYQHTRQVSDRPRTGRPRSKTVAQHRFVVISATELRADLRRASGVQVSTQTIKNRLPARALPLLPAGILLGRRTPLVPFDGTMTGERYIREMLRPIVLPSREEIGY